MAPHSSTLAWKIPWMEEPGRLQSMGSLRVGHDWATSLSRIGEGNGNPLQCSCLENPRDGGAWWAAVYGVAQNRTRLRWLSSSSSSPITWFFYFYFLVIHHVVVAALLSHVWLFVTLWTVAQEASLSSIFWSLLKFMSIKSVMLSKHLILCHPPLLLLSIFSSIRVFSKGLALGKHLFRLYFWPPWFYFWSSPCLGNYIYSFDFKYHLSIDGSVVTLHPVVFFEHCFHVSYCPLGHLLNLKVIP